MTNPLLETWETPFGLPPFDAIADAHFGPAIDAALTRHAAEIEAIAANPAAPDFDNTIGALEAAGETLDRVLGVFFNLAAADANPARQALQRQVAPRLADHFSAIATNAALFARIRELWERRQTLGLDREQARVLDLTHRRFVRAGAGLGAESAARLRAIQGRLAELGTAFTQNVLADEAGWIMELSAEDLEGLPDFLVEAARAAGVAAGRAGPVLTLSRSLVVPFLQFSPRRDLRRRVWEAWTGRGAGGGATDNRAIAAEILRLRHERARLLGYRDFAHYKLETEMAQTPSRARSLLTDVWKPARARAEADAAALQAIMQADGVNGPLAPWDWRYYAERRRRICHDIDDAALKPHLQLDRMIDAAFDVAGRLFGLSFRPLQGVPLYHPDLRVWEVQRDGAHVGIFIGDWFARPSKRSGAWCSTFRSQRRHPVPQSPVVVNVCNFARPAGSAPALLSWDEARTLFHEFGHALHHLLSDVTYGSIAGTAVARDFVELPSQLFEHWLEVPEVLERFATHVETGAPMPAEMVERLKAAATADAGFETVEYIASALVDLDFHEGEPPADPMARQAEVLAAIGMPEAIAMRHATPHFAHVFAGDGYAAGYYSYMWSEVMDADAFAAFEEAGGPFDPVMARRLERAILSRGGAEEPEALYVAFRGRLPGVEALLKGRGLA